MQRSRATPSLFLVAFLGFFSPTTAPCQQSPAPKISVQLQFDISPDDLKNEITSYLKRELRSLRDVTEVDAQPDYRIKLLGMTATTKAGDTMQCGRLVRPANRGQVAVRWEKVGFPSALLHTRPRPGKRRRALRERNPPGNTRLQTNRNDGCGMRLPGRIPPCPLPHRIDRSAHALKTHASNSRRSAYCHGISNCQGVGNPRL